MGSEMCIRDSINMNNTILKSMDGNLTPGGNFKPSFEPNFSANNSDIVNTNSQSQKVYFQNDLSQVNQYHQQSDLKIAPYQQSLSTRWAENVNLNKVGQVNSDHNEEILCIYFLNDRYIATGSRDKSIIIYTVDGQKVTTLYGH